MPTSTESVSGKKAAVDGAAPEAGLDRRPIVENMGRLVRILAAAVLGLYLAFALFVATNIHRGVDPAGTPLGVDFSTFYQAARFAASGHAADAYDDDVMLAAVKAAFPGSTIRLPWNYPPVFQLILAPLASLPYWVAWLAWSVILFFGYAWTARSLGAPPLFWFLLLFPGAVVNLYLGQNGLLMATLMGGGMVMLDRRPRAAGALFALTVCKPHLAILIPSALLCGREWKALGAVLAAGAGLIGLSVAALGVAPWISFVDKVMTAPAMAPASSTDWRMVPSALSVARNLGFSPTHATALYLAVALAGSVMVMLVWRRSADWQLRAGALAAGALVVTPYLRAYDLALLLLPMAALAHGLGAAAVRRLLIAAAWILPAAILALLGVAVLITPVFLLLMLAFFLWESLGGKQDACVTTSEWKPS